MLIFVSHDVLLNARYSERKSRDRYMDMVIPVLLPDR